MKQLGLLSAASDKIFRAGAPDVVSVACKTAQGNADMEQPLTRRHKMAAWIHGLAAWMHDYYAWIVLAAIGITFVVSRLKQKNNAPAGTGRRLNQPRYTKEDQDLIRLMQALAEVYRKTDEPPKKTSPAK